MAYIDLLRKYNDNPQIGMGGGQRGGNWFTNLLDSIFKPAPKVSSSPAVQAYVNKNPTINLAPKVPTNNYGTSTNYTTSNTSSGLSKPSTSFTSPLQSSGTTISLPSSSGTSNLPTFSSVIPLSYSSMLQKITSPLLGGMISSYPSNRMSNPSQTVKPELVGGLGKLLTSVGTALHAPQLLPGGLGARLQSAAGYVQAAEPSSKLKSYVATGSDVANLNNKSTTVNRGQITDNSVNMNELQNKLNADAGSTNAANQGTDAWLAKAMNDTNNIANDASLLNYAESNGLSQEQYNQEVYNRQKQILEEKYGILGAEADQMIADAQKDKEAQDAAEAQRMATFQRNTQQQQDEQKVYADELLKKSRAAQTADEQKLRNVFSNLGTAESSAFINKLMDYTGERQAEQSGITRDAQKLVDQLGMNLVDETSKSNANLKNYADTLASTISQIGNYKRGLGNQSAQDMATILENLGNAIMTGRNNLFNVKSTIAQNAAARDTANQNTLLNYGLNKSLSEDAIQAQKSADIQGINNTLIGGKYVRPRGFSTDLWNLANQLYNGGARGTNLVAKLKAARIPDAQDWMYQYLLNPV